MTEHVLKTWPQYFKEIKAGNKVHELRIMDRDYKVGDILVLQEYDPVTEKFSGDYVHAEITYITDQKQQCAFFQKAMNPNFGILSIKVLN